MIETVDSESSKSVSELMGILRWEDDGGAMFEVFEEDDPIPQVAETNNPRSMDVTGDELSYDKLKKNHSQGDKK
jgi:hypothetical protein